MKPRHTATLHTWRQSAYELFEGGASGGRAGLFVQAGIVATVVASVLGVTLSSVASLADRYGAVFDAIEMIALVVFTVELAFRLWVAAEHPLHRHMSPARARLKFLLSPAGLIDLAAVLPFWLAFVFPSELQVLVILRVLRLLKLGRYSPAMRALLDAIYQERLALVGCFALLIGVALIAGTAMYLIEHDAQPDKLASIPDGMWWAIVTLGTIGYGDVVPVTTGGRITASLTIFMGLIILALPIGIISSAFANDIHRRNFVVTWAMVARVPLFAGLDAAQISHVMRLLRAQRFEAGAIIARRGEPAHSMYFISAGEVEIHTRDRTVRLAGGHFFGEVAVLRKARRSATVTAVTTTSLLVLDAYDVQVLMEREPLIAERIRHTARERVGEDVLEPKGDIVTTEIEDVPARDSDG